MFDMIKNITKATIAVAVTPVTLAADVVTSPFDAINGRPLHRTFKKLIQAEKAIDAVVTTGKDDSHVG